MKREFRWRTEAVRFMDELRKQGFDCKHTYWNDSFGTTYYYVEWHDPHWAFLENLRESGATNMFGAVPYLQKEFGLDKHEARKILIDWMENYNAKDYE